MTRPRVDLASALMLPGLMAALALAVVAALGLQPAEVLGDLAAGGASYVLRTVAAGAIVVGAAGGVLGSFAVTRRQSLLGDAVSHAALPGIFLVFMAWSAAGLSGAAFAGRHLPEARSLPVVLVGALAAGLVATAMILTAARLTRLKEDAALAVTLSSFFGLGIVLRSYLQTHPGRFGNRAGLEAFLYGSTSTMSRDDVLAMAAVTGVAVLAVVVLWKELKLLAFDPDYLATLGYPVRALDILLTGLIVAAVIVGLQMVGVILMSALLIAPAVGARQWTDDFARLVGLAVVFGAASGLVGVVASSARANVATGPIIAVYALGLALASLALAPNRGLAWRAVRQARQRRRFQVDTLVLHLDGHAAAPTRADLAAQLGWAPGLSAAVVDRAAAAGLVAPADGRVALTTAGHAHVRAVLADLAGAAGQAP